MKADELSCERRAFLFLSHVVHPRRARVRKKLDDRKPFNDRILVHGDAVLQVRFTGYGKIDEGDLLPVAIQDQR